MRRHTVMTTRSITNPFRPAPARAGVNRIRWLGALALLVGALLNLAVAPGISAAAAAQPSVTPAVGGPSTRFTFVAVGFKGDPQDNHDDKSNDAEMVSFWIKRPGGQAIRSIRDGADKDSDNRSSARASRAGDVEWTWRAPADAVAGAYTLVAHGNQSGHDVVIPFRIDSNNRGVVMA